MKRFVLGLMGVALAGVAAVAAFAPAAAAGGTPSSATTIVKWDAQAVINMTLVPNYATGFGQVKAVFGTQPAPTHGPNATGVGLGDVDFGDVLSGTDYIYKYAAELHVTSNDASGFKIYGEGAAAFNQNGGAGTAPLASTLFYASSTASGDTNTGFTPGLPFQQTSGTVTTGATYAGPGTIGYGGIYPGSPVASSTTATGTFFYDYLLKVPSSITTGGDYYVWVVYTVVGS